MKRAPINLGVSSRSGYHDDYTEDVEERERFPAAEYALCLAARLDAPLQETLISARGKNHGGLIGCEDYRRKRILQVGAHCSLCTLKRNFDLKNFSLNFHSSVRSVTSVKSCRVFTIIAA